MGRWLAKLDNDKSEGELKKNTENAPIIYRQNRQKSKKGTFVSFVGSESSTFQKKKSKSGRWLSKVKNSPVSFVGSGSVQKQTISRPKIWSLKIKTGDCINTMTVIDPERLNDDGFLKQQILIFGKERIISFNEKAPAIKKGI
jgi:hypothetical protein